MRTLALALLLTVVFAAGAAAAEPTTPNEFLARGLPTFVAGTAGDDASDLKIRAQIDLIRGMLFQKSKVILDTDIDLTRGIEGWPANPVLYGGLHVNSVVAALADRLPFSMAAGKLTLGNVEFTGPEYRLITVIPGAPGAEQTPAFPPFLLYAGTGTPGIAEINAIRHGAQSWLLADRFGVLQVGAWADPTDLGSIRRGFRVPWRGTGVVQRPRVIPESDIEAAQDRAIQRGLTKAMERIAPDQKWKVQVHLYPDRRSKQSLTGNLGYGHADITSSTLHVLPTDPRESGPLENLVAHEATHVIAYHLWGPPGTPLFAEGLAVWVADSYGGATLAEWERKLSASRKSVAELLGPMFRRLPENDTYPVAGILVGALIEKIGIEKFRKHLYPATPETWKDACQAAGIAPDRIEALIR